MMAAVSLARRRSLVITRSGAKPSKSERSSCASARPVSESCGSD